MRKIRVAVVLVAGVWAANFWGDVMNAKADDNTLMQGGNEVLNDEGYGNTDDEYNNSEDDRVNDEEASGYQETGNTDDGSSGPQENSLTNAQQ